jgi:hypothetical protein
MSGTDARFFAAPPARIDIPGIYTIPDDHYLADPVVQPSLNASTIKPLIQQSPRHAWASHPRLGGKYDEDRASSEAQDVGHVAHAMFLLGEDAVAVLNVTDFRTKAAQQARDEAIGAGKIPLKKERYQAVILITNELQRFRDRTGAFTDGRAEQSLIWQEPNKRWGRGKVDWLPNEPSAYLWDLKTTSGSAMAWARTATDMGYDIQAAYYPRGCEILRGEPPAGMKFCVIETKPPFGIRVHEFSPAAIEGAQADCYQAVDLWDHCLTREVWPNYTDDTEWIDPPPWKVREREWRRNQRADLLRPAADAAALEIVMRTGNPGI